MPRDHGRGKFGCEKPVEGEGGGERPYRERFYVRNIRARASYEKTACDPPRAIRRSVIKRTPFPPSPPPPQGSTERIILCIAIRIHFIRK